MLTTSQGGRQGPRHYTEGEGHLIRRVSTASRPLRVLVSEPSLGVLKDLAPPWRPAVAFMLVIYSGEA